MVFVIIYITVCCRPAKSGPPSIFWYYELRIVFPFINSHRDFNRTFHDLWKFSEIRLVPVRRSCTRAYACPLVCVRIGPLSRWAVEAGSCDRCDSMAHKSFKYLFSRKTANPWQRRLEEEFLVAKQGGYWSAASDVISSHTNNSLHPSRSLVLLSCSGVWRAEGESVVGIFAKTLRDWHRARALRMSSQIFLEMILCRENSQKNASNEVGEFQPQ